MITNPNEVYELVELIATKCREDKCDDIAQQFDDAMHLGSSGMEILGAIKLVFITHSAQIRKIVDQATVDEIITFINKSFGME